MAADRSVGWLQQEHRLLRLFSHRPEGAEILELSQTELIGVHTLTDTVQVGDIVALGTNTNPVGLAITPDGSKVFVANDNANTVTVITTSNDHILTTVSVGANPMAFGTFIH
jgi:YVTN family beta-propeller protein